MPKITITEVDNTLSSFEQEVSNVVYIPGFSTARINMDVQRDDFVINTISDVPTGAPARVPKLCTTLRQFVAYFGSQVPKFANAQTFPVYTEESPNADGGFDIKAIPTNQMMFEVGDSDPSYIMAYELLRQGIPVLYERVNYFSNGTYKTGSGVPTGTIEAEIGDIYLDSAAEETQPNVYICTKVNNGITSWQGYTDIHYEVESSEHPEHNLVADIDVRKMYSFLSVAFKESRNGQPNTLFDRNEYDIKYLTSGGYPSFEYVALERTIDPQTSAQTVVAVKNSIVTDMLNLCENDSRQDAIALIDHTNNPDRKLTGDTSVFGVLNGTDTDYQVASDYAAMFTPYFLYTSVKGTVHMPASFAYLISLSEMIKSNENWLAVAGVMRGVVPNAIRLNTNQKLTNTIANLYTDEAAGIKINPITNIRNYGLTIWGNRTLAHVAANTEKALYYLNMRSLINEVKKVCYKASQKLMFEQNSDILWVNFKSMITPLLDRMHTSAGLANYKIIRQESDKKTEVKALIKLYPIYAVEAFNITVMLTNDEVEFEEEE